MKKSNKKREFLMKRNLKIFLLIAVCLITGCCLLYIREENEKQQIHSEKQEKETLVFLTSKRETRHIFEKIIDDFNESQDDIYVEHLEVPNPDQELQIRAVGCAVLAEVYSAVEKVLWQF